MRNKIFAIAAACLAAPAVGLATPIAPPLPIAKVSGELMTVSHLSEVHKGRHIRATRFVAHSRSRRTNPGIAFYPSGRGLGHRPVAPGDPGNPYLQSDFDRAVQATQYNGR